MPIPLSLGMQSRPHAVRTMHVRHSWWEQQTSMVLLKRLAVDSVRRTAEIWKPRLGWSTDGQSAPPHPVSLPSSSHSDAGKPTQPPAHAGAIQHEAAMSRPQANAAAEHGPVLRSQGMAVAVSDDATAYHAATQILTRGRTVTAHALTGPESTCTAAAGPTIEEEPQPVRSAGQ